MPLARVSRLFYAEAEVRHFPSQPLREPSPREQVRRIPRFPEACLDLPGAGGFLLRYGMKDILSLMDPERRLGQLRGGLLLVTGDGGGEDVAS